MVTAVKIDPGRTRETGAKNVSAAVFRNHTAASFTIPEICNFCHACKGFYLGKGIYYWVKLC